MLREKFYSKIEKFLTEWATVLKENGFTANQLTVAGCSINFLAGCLLARGYFFLSGLIIIVASLAELLDGPLANLTEKNFKVGTFLDSTLSCYSDFFIFGGLTLFYAKQGEGLWFLLCMGILLGSFITSYTEALADSLGEPRKKHLFERAERIFLVVLGSVLTPLLSLTIWILFLGTNATAIQRIAYTYNRLNSDTFKSETENNDPTA